VGKSESRGEPAGITCHRAGRIAVIEVPGSFDIYVNPKIRELAVTLQRDGATVIVFDLAVTAIDTTALGVIGGTHRSLVPAGGQAAVAAASEPAARLFRAFGLDVPVFSSRQDAIRAASQETGPTSARRQAEAGTRAG
jgi:anti-anti-sigma factor